MQKELLLLEFNQLELTNLQLEEKIYQLDLLISKWYFRKKRKSFNKEDAAVEIFQKTKVINQVLKEKSIFFYNLYEDIGKIILNENYAGSKATRVYFNILDHKFDNLLYFNIIFKSVSSPENDDVAGAFFNKKNLLHRDIVMKNISRQVQILKEIGFSYLKFNYTMLCGFFLNYLYRYSLINYISDSNE